MALAAFAGAAIAGAPARAGGDPIHEALLHGRAGGPPARLELEILELTPAHGMKTIGRFSAPLDAARAARLRRRIDLPPPSLRTASSPAQVELEVVIRSRWLSEARLWLDIDSSASLPGSATPAAHRRTSEALAAGRSALAEIFRIPGTPRRLALAVSWSAQEGEAPTLPAGAGALMNAPVPGRILDILVELVRVEKGREHTLRRQALKAIVGAEARTSLQLVQRRPGGADLQQLDLRLTPRTLEGGILLMGVQVRGRLEAEEDALPLLVDHRDDARLRPGRGYSLPLGGASAEGPSYRLDITPNL
jgi:hypothetical protein